MPWSPVSGDVSTGFSSSPRGRPVNCHLVLICPKKLTSDDLSRAYALQRNRPLTLQASINPPTLADDPTDPLAHHLNSFVLLINLFRPFDDAFVASWNKSRSNWPPAHINSLQKQLTDTPPSLLSYGDSQLHDLRTNQQWLKTMMWQLSVNNSNVNNNGEDSMMFQQYSANMANNLLSGISSMPQQNSDLLNVPLVC